MRRRRRRPSLAVNIVPLVDVLIILIFFFLVTMQMRETSTLNIVPPKMESAGQTRVPMKILIAIDAEGKFYYNDTPVLIEELEAALKQTELLKGDEGKPPVLIVSDENTPIKWVTQAMDMARLNGLDKIRLQTR